MPTVTKADVKEFVEAAHGDLPKVQQMLVKQPELLQMPNGNETALGAACQMRRVDIIQFLLGQGAEMTISAACVLGQTDKVAEFLTQDSSLLSKGDKQAHNKHPIYFAENQPETLEFLKSKGAKYRMLSVTCRGVKTLSLRGGQSRQTSSGRIPGEECH